jgi:hypothetical protein
MLKKNKKVRVCFLYPFDDILESKTGTSRHVNSIIKYFSIKQKFLVSVIAPNPKNYNKKFKIKNKILYIFYKNPNFNFFQKLKFESYCYFIFLNYKIRNFLKRILKLIYFFKKISIVKKFFSKINTKNDFDKIDFNHFKKSINLSTKIFFEKNIKNYLKKFDIIFVNYIYFLSKYIDNKALIILLTHDILSNQFFLQKMKRDFQKIEKDRIKICDGIISFTKEDMKYYIEISKNSKNNYCVPICVFNNKSSDLNQYIPLDTKISSVDSKLFIRNNENYYHHWFTLNKKLFDGYSMCLFVGSSHKPNIKAVKILKEICSKINQNLKIIFVIVGLCVKTNNLEINESFFSFGPISNRFLNFLYNKSKIILSPILSGTGCSLKIIEAFQKGKFIIGTKIAFRGIEGIKNKENCIIENNLKVWSRYIEYFLCTKNKNEYEMIKRNSKKLGKIFNFKKVGIEYEKIVNKII